MKRMVSLFTLLALCAALICPVMAAEFVPSISDKGAPELVTTVDEEGNVIIGYVVNADGTTTPIDEKCLLITPVSRAKRSDEIPEEAADLLLDVYQDLRKGDMEIPYSDLFAELDSKKMVIRDLFDVSWLCEDHPQIVAPAGVHITLTFNLGVSKDTEVYVFTYKHEKWNNIVEVTNNGDGTVTCVFEDFCPVAFAVPSGSDKPPAQTGDPADITLWIVLMSVSAVALAAVVVFSRRKNVA